MAVHEIQVIEPQGKLHGSHVTPTDHTYIRHTKLPEFQDHMEAVQLGQAPQDWVPPYQVFSPADGYISEIDAFPFGPAPYGFTWEIPSMRSPSEHTAYV